MAWRVRRRGAGTLCAPAQERAAATRSTLPPMADRTEGIEPADPFEPVEGVTLERYAEAAVAFHRASGDDVESLAVANGIPAGRINAIAEVWNRRMAEHPEVVTRYSELYQQALRKAGIEAPDISFEQYVEILRRQTKGDPIAEVLSDFGLDLQTFALVSQRWIDEMQKDTSLAARMAELLGAGGSGPA
jgi:crotonobetainyl-CoA:carnitine CoA-transferase CaiB-like acyl-CoA transferase